MRRDEGVGMELLLMERDENTEDLYKSEDLLLLGKCIEFHFHLRFSFCMYDYIDI